MTSQASPAVSAREHPPPSVWLVMSYRAGENSQIVALADALGWPYEVKRIRHRKYEFVTNLGRGTGLRGIVQQESSPLRPPWPDLVISAGMRNEPVCRWIRTQNSANTHIVHIGRPWARPHHFDLIITTPQYRLPPHPVVLQNELVLHSISNTTLEKAAQRWHVQFEHLPKPWTAVLIGGNSGPYTLGSKAARRLGKAASKHVQRSGGSLLVTSSSRTSATVTETLVGSLEVPAYVHRWEPSGIENPYYAFLALAEDVIVTGDSIAMLTEACATAKPVYVFDPGSGAYSMRNLSATGNHSGSYQRDGVQDRRLSAVLYRQMMRFGPKRWSRDIARVHRKLIAAGRVVWLGDGFPEGRQLQPLGDVGRAVQRVKALFPSY